MVAIFRRDEQGRRPVFGGVNKFQDDPHWRDCLLFYEYFHGDNGAGIGASHQTGWTGLVARLVDMVAELRPEHILGAGETDAFVIGAATQVTHGELRRAVRGASDG
jgi:hypothetical protein